MFNLTKHINEIVQFQKTVFEHKQIQFSIISEEDLNIFADLKMIDSALRNLLSNAGKFTPSNGSVTITVKKDKEMAVVSIQDTGVGIPEGVIGKLFLMSENVGTKGTEGEPSTGLGLLLCKEFIEKNGGEIYVESEEGKGSKFSFTVPLSPS